MSKAVSKSIKKARGTLALSRAFLGPSIMVCMFQMHAVYGEGHVGEGVGIF